MLIKNSKELEYVVFCIENVATKLGVDDLLDVMRERGVASSNGVGRMESFHGMCLTKAGYPS